METDTFYLICGLLCCWLGLASPVWATAPPTWCNTSTLQGTTSLFKRTYGNTNPTTALPFAMNSPDNGYIQSATLNGQQYPAYYLCHGYINRGGKLVLVMNPSPAKSRGIQAADRSFSLSAPGQTP